MLAKRDGIETRNEGKVPLSVESVFLGPLGGEGVFLSVILGHPHTNPQCTH